MRFVISGRAVHCSREYVRAWLHASACVLAYHNRIRSTYIRVQIVAKVNSELCFGEWDETTKTIRLLDTLDPECMATTILHEMIHACCGHFGDDTDEKCCSTLTAKLKPHVHAIAQPLADATYKRAAYLAHTKLSYVTDEDHYDRAEDEPIGTTDRHGRRRKKKSA